MEIRQLEAFAAVMSAGSVTAAARLLDRSQPVVSRQVQDLEQEVGFTLFTRTRPQVTLTDQGRQFYEEVRNVLAGLQQLDNRSREIARGLSRPLRVAATFSLGASLLPQVIGRLENTNPVFDYKLYVDTMPPDQIVEVIADGQADIGVVSLPIDLGRCRLHWSGYAPCLVAIPARHPLAAKESIGLHDLEGITVITMSNRTRLRHRLSTALLQSDASAKPRRHVETSSSLNALMLVRAGVGIALVDPASAVHCCPDGVVLRSFQGHVPYMLGVISHRERVLPEDGQRLIDALWDCAKLTIPRFAPGDPSGLPPASDPMHADSEEEAG